MENEQKDLAMLGDTDDRGAGGKSKKSKRRAVTPYSRPHKPWLSKLVSPARHLITGIPSIISKFRVDGDRIEDQPRNAEQQEPDESGARNGDDANSPMAIDTVAPVIKPTSELEKTYTKLESEKLERRQPKFAEISDLVSGRSFTRNEVDRLISILNSKSIESTYATQDMHKIEEGVTGGALTVRHQSPLDVSGSPIDIARAYMRNRTSDASLSCHRTTSGGLTLKQPEEHVPMPSPSLVTRWPGALSHQDALSPNKTNTFGRPSFERTPYSRSIYWKTKSYGSNIFEKKHASLLDQAASPSSEAIVDSGSFGPIRRIKSQRLANTPLNLKSRSVHFSPLHLESTPKSSTEIYSSTNKNLEVRRDSSLTASTADGKPKSRQFGVPSHSSHLARRILEQLDRNPPTPKEKSDELKFAASWSRKSFGNDLCRTSDHTANPEEGIKDADQFNPAEMISQHSELKVPSSSSQAERTLLGLHKDAAKPTSKSSSPEQDSMPKRLPHLGTKPALPPIAVAKPVGRWGVPSDKSTFTFPVSVSSGVMSELPTPSVAPQGNSDKEAPPVPYKFGTSRSSPLAFSFPSVADSADSDASGLKFSFGSEEHSRISFSFAAN